MFVASTVLFIKRFIWKVLRKTWIAIRYVHVLVASCEKLWVIRNEGIGLGYLQVGVLRIGLKVTYQTGCRKRSLVCLDEATFCMKSRMVSSGIVDRPDETIVVAYRERARVGCTWRIARVIGYRLVCRTASPQHPPWVVTCTRMLFH